MERITSALLKAWMAFHWVNTQRAWNRATFSSTQKGVRMNDRQHKIMTEAEFDALCDWLGGPEGCNFQQEIHGDPESITWTCDGTLKLTRHWMRVHGVDTAANIPELEERGGYCDCEVLFNVSHAPRDWLGSN